MPMFIYTVKDDAGKTKTDTIQSFSEDALVLKLQSEGYFVVNIRPLAEKTATKIEQKAKVVNTKFDHEKTKIEDLLVLSRQLATMLEAGVTMLRSLDVITSQIQSREL